MARMHEAVLRPPRPKDGIARLRTGSIAFLSYGFRPFFLGAGVWAVLAMALWIGLVTGQWSFASEYGAVAWHAHEMLFGYTTGVATGFLLTAIPNWTGRLPVQGRGLLGLFLLWVGGRIAFLLSDWIGVPAAVAIDSAFLFVLAGVIIREIVAGKNWRNLKVAVLVALLGCANVAFHAEVLLEGAPDYGVRLALAVILGMIMLIGGRIIPSFTHNWLARRKSQRLPAVFGRFDILALAIAALALVAWVAAPNSPVTSGLLLAAALTQTVRLARWAGDLTWREPLVLVLHVGYAFVPIGFVLQSISILWPSLLPSGGALHAWTVGAIGVMTLAVMTRATLGHTGRPLTSNLLTGIIYLAIAAAALARIGAALWPSLMMTILVISASCWLLAFAIFTLHFGPMLAGPRQAQ